MKKYYIISAIVAVGILIVSLVFSLIGNNVVVNKKKSQLTNIENTTVILRYYETDDYNNSPVVYLRVQKDENFQIIKIPHKEGYTFLGLFDKPDFKTATIYVDSNGQSKLRISEDTLLYPIFVKE